MKIDAFGGRGFIGFNIVKRMYLDKENIFFIDKEYFWIKSNWTW
jgi:hypothetical protein